MSRRSLTVTREDPQRADYARADVLYAGMPPRDLGPARRLKWVQLHMAGVNALYDHPLYTESAVTLTTTSGVHAATIAEYAITVLLALAHRVPRMVEWQRPGRLAARTSSAGRCSCRPRCAARRSASSATAASVASCARIAKTAFAMRVLACKRDPAQRADAGYCLPGTGDPDGRAARRVAVGPHSSPALLAQSDVVVHGAPLTPADARHMIGAARARDA